MVGAVDNRHLDRRAAQRLRGEQPGEARADDHDAVPGGQLIHLFAYISAARSSRSSAATYRAKATPALRHVALDQEQ